MEFFMFKIIATVREDFCKPNSSILELVLEVPYEQFQVHSIEALKPLADKRLLFTEAHGGYPSARVNIYWNSHYRRWVATTRSDYTQCNNLHSLPIYYPASKFGTTRQYQICTI